MKTNDFAQALCDYAKSIITMNTELRRLSDRLTADDDAHYPAVVAGIKKIRGIA